MRRGAWILAGLAALELGWAGFQWYELRAPSEGFCAWGEGCDVVTHSAFARAVQQRTRVPIAGWGVIWSAAALALPLLAGARAGRHGPREPWRSATLLLALGGVAGVAGLAMVSAGLGQWCANCLISYALVLAYAAVCWMWVGRTQRPGVGLLRGAPAALGALAAAFAASLYPALHTPTPGAAREALPQIATGGNIDRQLEAFVGGLGPAERQALSQALAAYAASPAQPLHPPRALLGSPSAPVRLTEFFDALCSHCASLHEVLTQLRQLLPPALLAIESRHFPLDASCNAQIAPPPQRPLRCQAAKLLLCVEQQPFAFELAGEIFAHQDELTEAKLYSLAGEHVGRAELDSCIASPQTQSRLDDDIAWALEHHIRGTPLVLINGRSAPNYPPFLLAIALARGNAHHPAFGALAPPS